MKTFTSSKGAVLELKPVSQFKIDTLRASKVDVSVPVYQAMIVGGGTQEYPLDAEIAKNKNRLPEWEAYQAAHAKQEADYAKKFLELMIWDGTEVCVPDVESDWQKSSDYFGITIPVNPIERKLFFVYNELLGTPEDIGELIAEIFSVSKIDEEAVQNLRDSFRAGIQRQTHKPVSKKQGRLEGKPNVLSVGSDSLLAKTPV